MPHKIAFRVFHVTSEDENFPAVELNHHSPATRGWISSRFCTYPQRVMLVLDQRARLCKIQVLCHQYLIASKVEFFVGDPLEGTKSQVQNAQYTRLGYVSLSDNETTKFKARELKSVHVDAVGSCVQLVLHKNHSNKYNTYNQVGLVAVNLIGDLLTEPGITKVTRRSFSSQRMDIIPPTEDLAFDIYQDPEVANIIRCLEKQKLAAVTDERFDEAQKLRNIIERLQHVGERLGRLVLEKQHAVEEENYERAKLKKYQIDEIRTSLYRDPDISKLLSEHLANHSKSTSEGGSPVNRYSSEAPHEQFTYQGDAVPHPSSDDRPLPALKHRSRNNNAVLNVSPNRIVSTTAQQKDSDAITHQVSNLQIGNADESSDVRETEEHQASELVDSSSVGIDETINSDLPSSPESLNESHRRLAAVAIDVVGLPLVTKLFSKSWVFRQHALMDLEKRVCAPNLMPPVSAPDVTGPDPQAELRSSAFLLQRSLQDQVLSVFRMATGLIKSTIVDFSDRYAIAHAELYHALEKLLPTLFHRTGDTSVRIREVAKAQIILMAQWPQVRQCSAFWSEVVRPFSPVTLDRLALSRLEIVTELYASLGVESPTVHGSAINHGGFTLDSLAVFTTRALNHRSNEVRDLAENLMVALYRAENRVLIRRTLPPNNINTQRHPLFRRLFSKFDRIDEKYPQIGVQYDNDRPESAKKQKEVDALQIDVRQLRSTMNQERRRKSVPARASQSTINPNRSRKSKTLSQPSRPSGSHNDKSSSMKSNVDQESRNSRHVKSCTPPSPLPHSSVIPQNSQQPSSQSTGEPDLLLNLDKTCIFCGERNDDFTEDGLDLHYWKDCPMLHQCHYCNQVVEVAGLFEHLLSECDSAITAPYVRCDRCSEAVRQSDLKSHPCVPCTPSGLRCPLCHSDLPLTDSCSGLPLSPEDAWKSHLIGSDTATTSVCSSNPRRFARPQQAIHVGSEPLSFYVDNSEVDHKVPSKQTATTAHRTLIPRPTHPSHVRPV